MYFRAVKFEFRLRGCTDWRFSFCVFSKVSPNEFSGNGFKWATIALKSLPTYLSHLSEYGKIVLVPNELSTTLLKRGEYSCTILDLYTS